MCVYIYIKISSQLSTCPDISFLSIYILVYVDIRLFFCLSSLTLLDIKILVIHFDIYISCYLGEEEGSGGGMDMGDRNGNIGRATTFNPWQRKYFFFCT